MAKSDEAQRREQRLAAKLRENLGRRKLQARGRAATLDKPESAINEATDGGDRGALKPAGDSDS